MNTKVKRIIFAILIIINCIVIFNFSSQNSEKSNETSGMIVEKVVNIISTISPKVEKETIKEQVSFWVRKLAHFSIYTLLGIFLMNEANTFKMTKKRKIIICMLFGALYAISDEFHQGFVGGRSPKIMDVCIDTCGVIFGIILVIIAGKLISKIKEPKKLPAVSE
ncbi:MAG: VanZ family protein [Clostridia bacterium]|nr:VanZ family protein [Clostridia bacterium]